MLSPLNLHSLNSSGSLQEPQSGYLFWFHTLLKVSPSVLPRTGCEQGKRNIWNVSVLSSVKVWSKAASANTRNPLSYSQPDTFGRRVTLKRVIRQETSITSRYEVKDLMDFGQISSCLPPQRKRLR